MLNVEDRLQGRYEIKKVRQGGLVVSYIAFDHVSEKLVTIETLRDEHLNHKDLVEGFLKQGQIVMKLRECPHVVRAERATSIGGKSYIFWEYLDGWTLREEIRKQTLDLTRSLDFAIQFCIGMDCIHNVDLGNGRKGIVHRDIKPENIMITPDAVLKITDFFLAKAVDEAVKGIAGTPPYMSPEQFHTTDVDQRSDIYSFGAVLYEMLTGQMVFPMRDYLPEERWNYFARQHQEVLPKLPRQINPLIPVALEQVVLKCLEKKPKERWQSFENLREELRQVYRSRFGQIPEVKKRLRNLTATQLTSRGTSLLVLGARRRNDTVL
jgi:serine/threonine protein kinase